MVGNMNKEKDGIKTNRRIMRKIWRTPDLD